MPRARPASPTSLLYDAFLELIGRWTTDVVAAQMVARSGVDLDERSSGR